MGDTTNMCEHEWRFQEKQLKYDISGYERYKAHFHRIDLYYCCKCCEQKKIEKKEVVSLPFGGRRNVMAYAPVWYS